MIDAEFLSASIKNVPLFFTSCGMSLSFILIHGIFSTKFRVYSFKMTSIFRRFHMFLATRWHFDQLITELITNRVMGFGYLLSFQLLDKGLIEFFGPLGSSSVSFSYSRALSLVQTGFVAHFLIVVFLASLLFLSFSVFTNFIQISSVLIVVSYIVLVFS